MAAAAEPELGPKEGSVPMEPGDIPDRVEGRRDDGGRAVRGVDGPWDMGRT